MSQPRSNKRHRELARRDKAIAKAARRDERKNEEANATSDTPVVDQEAVLAQLAALHAKFDDDQIPFEEFEAARQELIERLNVT